MKHTCKVLLLSLVVLPGCAACYDPALEHPDGYGGGYNLTPLGCLIYGPWKPAYSVKNIMIRHKDSIIASFAGGLSAVEQTLVFELERDHTVRYWSDSTDESALLHNGQIVYKTSRPYKPRSPEKVPGQFTGGKWVVNWKDSTIDIAFTHPGWDLPGMHRRCASIGSDDLHLQKITNYDTVINNTRTVVSRIETICYNHPWVYSFN